MGKGVVENGVIYEACTECRRVCETTHGKGLPHSLPRFFKTISEYSTPSSSNCNLQVPASYIRNYIGLNKKEKYVLEAGPGCEWAVTFNTVALKLGWKEFSMDYQLEKGDGIMFSLVAPKRFYVNVFDKFGMEKVSTKQPSNTRASPISKENQVANSTSAGGAAEDQCTPLDSNGTHLHREEKSDDAPHHTVPGASARTSDQNGNHENGTLFKDKHHLFYNKPVGHEAEPSTMSQSSDDSEDSIQVRLAKAVLVKARQRKLKKRRKTSCTSTPQAAGTTTRKEGSALGAEACKNEDRADGTSNVDPTGSPLRNDGTAASVDEAMFENPCEELRALTNTRRSLIIRAVIGASNVEEVNELQAESQPEKLLQEKGAPLPHLRPETATGEGVSLRRVESNDPAKDRPSPPFQPGLVKLEPDLIPHQTSAKCASCGLRKDVTHLDRSTPLKLEPVTTESLSPDVRIPEARSPKSNAPRVTEHQKQLAMAAASELSANTKNPNALVVMRVSLSADHPYDCFLSVMCSEMLPSVPTELTLMDTEGNARRVNWKPNQRNLHGPGWKDFVDLHNLQSTDVSVMEVIDPSEHNFVVKVHIFHAHEMERSPDSQPPAVPATPVSTVPAKTPEVQAKSPAAPAAPVPVKTPAVQAKTPAVPAKTPAVQPKTPAVQPKTPAVQPKTPAVQPKTPAVQPKTPAVPALVTVRGTPAPVRGTGAKTRSSNLLHGLVASPTNTNKRTRTANVDEPAVQTEIPRPAATNTTVDDRALIELARPSPLKRPRRGSSSPSTPGRGRDSTPTSVTGEEPSQAAKPARKVKQQTRRRHSLYTPHGQRKANAEVVAAKRGGASQSASKVQLRSSTADESAENPKQVRTRNSQKTHYKVAKMIDRRKSLQGVVFLVELTEKVSLESSRKKMKAQRDEKGRWWVPHHHFSKDFATCYIE